MPHKRRNRNLRSQEKAKIGHNLPPTAVSHNRRKAKANAKESQDEFGGLPKNVYRILNAERIRAEYHKRNRGEDTGEGEGRGRKRKRPAEGDESVVDGKGKGKEKATELKIMPGEKLKEFNRRVEESLRPEVDSAIRATKSAFKRRREKEKARLAAADDDDGSGGAGSSKSQGADKDADDKTTRSSRDGPTSAELRKSREELSAAKAAATDFARAPVLRLHDIAMAPPSFSRVPKDKEREKREKLEAWKRSLAKGGDASDGDDENGAGADGAREKGARLGVSPAQARMLAEERERVIKRYRELKGREREAKERERAANDERRVGDAGDDGS